MNHAVALRGASCLAALIAGMGAVPARAESAAQLDEVVVTATRRPELSKDVPIALSAFGEKDLARRQPTDIADLQTALPNVSLNTSGNTVNIDPVVRGISSNTRNAGVESGLAVYVDGVYTGRPETFNVGLADAKSVEVLRGPQGTLFGKNAIAGALSVTTQDPTDRFAGRVSATYGSENLQRYAAMLNLPLDGAQAGLRADIYRERRDGYVTNLFNHQTVGNDDNWGGRLKARFALGEDLDLILAGDYRKDDRRPYFGEIRTGVAPDGPPPKPVVAPGPFTTNDDHAPNTESRALWGVSATANYRAPGGFTVASITAFRSLRHAFQEDNDFSPADEIFVDFNDKQTQFSQELRLVSPDTGRLKYVAGLYYYWQGSNTRHVGELGSAFAIPGLVPGGITKVVVPKGEIETKSYAAYADGSYKLTEKLELLAGLRLTREAKTVTFSVTPDPVLVPLFYLIPQADDRIAATDVSPTLGLRYKPTEDLTAYGRIARGYKSGGWNLDFISRSAAPNPTVPSLRFQPEQVTNYEAGFKGQFLDRRLVVDAAAFYMDYQDLQVTQFFGLAGGAVTSNAASATIKGVEGDVTALLAPGLSVGATFGYNDARYDRFPSVNAAGDKADGKRLPGPRTTASFNAASDFAIPGAPGTFSAFAEYSYRGSGFVTPLNEARLELPERSLVNARLSWAASSWRASLYVENLFDKTYQETIADDPFASTPEEIVTFGRPRTFGVSLTAEF